MPSLDADALTDLVLQTIETALGPVLERLSVSEARIAMLGDVRDRVVAIEAKAAVPSAADPAIAEMRDRLLTLETKAGMPSVADALLTDVKTRLVALEQSPAMPAVTTDVAVLRDRLTALESKAASPTCVPPTFTPSFDRDLAECRSLCEGLRQSFDGVVAKAVGDLRERLAVVEVRAPIPGPPGPAGRDGTDGKDGLGFDDLVVEQPDERSLALKAVRGDRVKTLGTFRLPVQLNRGVYVEGKSYEPGDVVTWGGSQWHCNEETGSKPGDGSKAWTLVVKRGRDGKDGRDAVGALPVVKA